MLAADGGADAPAVPPRGGWFGRARLGFRRWRRTRPFWGGLIALLGGLEILLSERAPVAVVVHLGAQGLAGYVVPVVLVLCALLLWFNPAQRVFYSILAVLAALASFITSNLGGFVLGMLLGIVGGSLAFAWVPGEPPKPPNRRRARPAASQPSEGLALVTGDRGQRGVAPPGGDAAPGPAGEAERGSGGDAEPGPDPGASAGSGRLETAPGGQPRHRHSRWDGRPRRGSTLLAALPVPLALAVVAPLSQLVPAAGPFTPGPAVPTVAGPVPSASAAPSPSTGTTSPSPDPSGSPAPSTAPSPSPTPSPAATSPAPSPSPSAPHKKAAAPSLTASGSQSSISAGSAVMTGLSYDGVANVRTTTGTVPMLMFSMDSMTLSGGTVLTVSENGHTVVTNDSSLDFNGNVVLYTTKITGQLLGVTVTFTPQSPPPLVLPATTFTSVVTDQPLTLADSSHVVQPLTSFS